MRHHVLTLVAVFLALAAGVALGSGPLQRAATPTSSAPAPSATADPQAETDLEQARAGVQYSDEVFDVLGTRIAQNRLGDKTVALVLLPGAPRSVATGLVAGVERAGGTVAGRYRVGLALGSVGQRQLVEELTTQLGSSYPALRVGQDVSGYQRLGQLLARGIAADDVGSGYDNTAQAIMSTLSTARLVAPVGEPTRRADLVLWVAGAAREGDDAQAALNVHKAVIGALAPRAGGSEVTGPASSARQGGLLAAVRADTEVNRAVSTVDSVETGAGQTVAVLTLAPTLDGAIRSYGAVDAADGAAPSATGP